MDHVDFWVLIVWPVVAFLIGSTIVALVKLGWKRVQRRIDQRHLDRRVEKLMTTGEGGEVVKMGEIFDYEKRHPGVDVGATMRRNGFKS